VKTVAVKLDFDDDETLESMAKARLTSKAALIRLIIKKYLIEQEKK
jgi:hypothetical protein